MTARGERGSAAVEFVWLTILLLVPLVYVMLAVFDAQRASYAVSSASKAAARAYVQAPDAGAAEQRARLAAQVALGDQDVRADVRVTCLPDAGACLQPGSSVRVTVSTVQPLPLAPSFLGSQAPGVAVDASYTERYGSYREGR